LDWRVRAADEEAIMLSKLFALSAAGLCLLAPAFADETPPGTGDARFTFNKTDAGFVRLDLKTGEVSLCSERTVGWACQAAPEDRAVLENEIARLRTENAVLKKEILDHGLPLPSGTAPETAETRDNELTLRLPSDAEVNRFTAYVGRVWHRLVEAIAQAQKQMLNKS
jgi:hypothetical protein